MSIAAHHSQRLSPTMRREVEEFRERGWITVWEAVESTGRGYMEMAALMESGEADFARTAVEWRDGIPRTVDVVHLDSLNAAPRRTPLRIVR